MCRAIVQVLVQLPFALIQISIMKSFEQILAENKQTKLLKANNLHFSFRHEQVVSGPGIAVDY